MDELTYGQYLLLNGRKKQQRMNEWEEENDNKQDTSKGENFKTRTESRQSRQMPTTFTFSMSSVLY